MGLYRAPECTEMIRKLATDQSNGAVYVRRTAAEVLGTIGHSDPNFDKAVSTLCQMVETDTDGQVKISSNFL